MSGASPKANKGPANLTDSTYYYEHELEAVEGRTVSKLFWRCVYCGERVAKPKYLDKKCEGVEDGT